MMISDEKVKRDLPILREKLIELRELSQAMPPRGFAYEESDHFGFMCLMYLAKQKEHAIIRADLQGFSSTCWRRR